MINMANSYGAIGREDEALKLRQATFALQKAKLGPAHRDTLVSMSNLALSYSLVGELTQALNLQEECVHLSKANLGTHHPTTLLNMLNLASIYKKAGRYAEALKLLEETLALQKEELGTDHPDLIMPMQFLSLIYGALGRYRDKLEVGERSLALCKAKLGRDHVLTIWTMQDLADSYYLLGRHAEALKLRQETLALRKAKVGPDDPDTLLTMASMALDLIAVHRDAEALGLIQEVIAKWGKLKTSDRGTLLSGAVYHAIAATARSGADQSTSSGQRASAEADSAIALLRQAVAAGYRDWGYIKGNARSMACVTAKTSKRWFRTWNVLRKKPNPEAARSAGSSKGQAPAGYSVATAGSTKLPLERTLFRPSARGEAACFNVAPPGEGRVVRHPTQITFLKCDVPQTTSF